MAKTSTKQEYTWVLKNKETGKIFPKFTYKSRDAARRASKGRRFNGDYMAFKQIFGASKKKCGDGLTIPKGSNVVTKTVSTHRTVRVAHTTPTKMVASASKARKSIGFGERYFTAR